MKTTQQTKAAIAAMCEGALMIAMAEILSFLPLYKMPWGGSIDLAMLPIFLFCFKWGFGPGMIVSTAHAVLQTLFEGGIAIGWQSIVGDFLLAYMILGTAGLFHKMTGGYYIGVTVGCVLRFCIHFVVGATIWAAYMPSEFFGMTMTSPWLYSALYNGAYMVPDCIAVLLVGWLLMKTPAKQYLMPQ